MAAARNIMTYD